MRRFSKPKLAPILALVAVVLGLGGAAMLTTSPHRTASLTAAARPSAVSPSAAVKAASSETTPMPSAGAVSPTPARTAVASAATTAPSPTATTAPKFANPTAAPPATPAPDSITLTVISPTATASYKVRLLPSADACTVLEQAKTEGKLTSLNIDYSYLKTFHSAYVREINGYENNWTVKVNGMSPLGCSLVSPKNNDNITWRYQ